MIMRYLKWTTTNKEREAQRLPSKERMIEMSETKRQVVYMPKELWERLRYAGIKLEKSLSQMAVEAIEEYLEKAEKEWKC